MKYLVENNLTVANNDYVLEDFSISWKLIIQEISRKKTTT